MNNLKLRASWGSIGNQNVDYYAYLPTIDAKNDYNWILPGTDKYVTTLGVPGLVSSSFTWETVNTLDIGVDLNLLNRLGIVSIGTSVIRKICLPQPNRCRACWELQPQK